MDVRFTQEQELLRATVRTLLDRRCSMAQVRAGFDAPGFAGELFAALAEAGLTALPFAEDVGGAGLGPVETMIVCEELGRALAPATWLSSAVLAGGVIDAAGSAAERARWLPALASGRTRAALAFLEARERWDEAAIALRARAGGGGLVIDGEKRFVLDADGADLFVVVVRDAADAVRAAVVPSGAPGLSIEPTPWIDPTRRAATLRLDGVTLSGDALLAGGWPAIARALDRARVALAAEMIGAAEAALAATIAFVKARAQFGRPIGAFQAVQHACADSLVALESARSATWAAAWALAEEEPDAAVEAAIAKALAGDAFAAVAARAIQLHGGLGFTWEQDPHLFYKRAKVSERLLGDASWCREIVARARVDAPGTGLR